jgi:parvulin-like peptidyl-prolyl isomerase
MLHGKYLPEAVASVAHADREPEALRMRVDARSFEVGLRLWQVAISVVTAALITPMTALPQISGAEPDPPSDLISLRIIVLGTAVEAEQIIKRVQAGESFPDLAKALSIDPTAETGGLLRAIRRSALRPELRDALNGLGPG